MQKKFNKLIGKKVKLLGDHPHAGKTGVIIDFGKTFFGIRPIIKLDNNDNGTLTCFVMLRNQMKLI